VAFEMTKLVGAEFPLFAFSHCRDVVAVVSRAGGFGVLGARDHGVRRRTVAGRRLQTSDPADSQRARDRPADDD